MITLKPGLLATILAALVAVFLLMPLIAVVPVSFTPSRNLSVSGDEWSLRHYRALIENPAWAKGFALSVGQKIHHCIAKYPDRLHITFLAKSC